MWEDSSGLFLLEYYLVFALAAITNLDIDVLMDNHLFCGLRKHLGWLSSNCGRHAHEHWVWRHDSITYSYCWSLPRGAGRSISWSIRWRSGAATKTDCRARSESKGSNRDMSPQRVPRREQWHHHSWYGRCIQKWEDDESGGANPDTGGAYPLKEFIDRMASKIFLKMRLVLTLRFIYIYIWLMTYLAPTFLSKMAKNAQFYSIFSKKNGAQICAPKLRFFFFELTKKCLFLQNGALSLKNMHISAVSRVFMCAILTRQGELVHRRQNR